MFEVAFPRSYFLGYAEQAVLVRRGVLFIPFFLGGGL
jgi:hypothetical protein